MSAVTRTWGWKVERPLAGEDRGHYLTWRCPACGGAHIREGVAQDMGRCISCGAEGPGDAALLEADMALTRAQADARVAFRDAPAPAPAWEPWWCGGTPVMEQVAKVERRRL